MSRCLLIFSSTLFPLPQLSPMRNQIIYPSICAWAYTKEGIKELQREVEFPELPRAFQTNKYARKEKKGSNYRKLLGSAPCNPARRFPSALQCGSSAAGHRQNSMRKRAGRDTKTHCHLAFHQGLPIWF